MSSIAFYPILEIRKHILLLQEDLQSEVEPEKYVLDQTLKHLYVVYRNFSKQHSFVSSTTQRGTHFW